MNTLFFKYAIEVEQTRSITKAAENLYMAQPNLSKAIRELEETLGFPIFVRSSKGVIPTDQGREFLKYAHSIMLELDKMSKISEMSDGAVQSFRISIPRGSYIAHGFTEFAAQLDPGKRVMLNVVETNSMQTIQYVLDGQSDLGIIRYQVAFEPYFMDYLREKQLAFEPIWEFAYLLLLSKEHPLADRPQISAEDLEHYTEIVHGDLQVPYLTEAHRSGYGDGRNIHSKIYLYERANQFELLNRIPSTFMWVSPVPDTLLNRYALIQRACRAERNLHKDLLIYPQGYQFRPIDRQFIDQLFAAKNEVAFKTYD